MAEVLSSPGNCKVEHRLVWVLSAILILEMIDNLKLLMNAEVTKATSNISGD
jgi:hypothetical protein